MKILLLAMALTLSTLALADADDEYADQNGPRTQARSKSDNIQAARQDFLSGKNQMILNNVDPGCNSFINDGFNLDHCGSYGGPSTTTTSNN